MSKQLNRAETFEDEGAQTSRSWWEDSYETEDSEACRKEQESHDSWRILNELPRPAAAPFAPPPLRIYDVISERGVVNLITADGERGATLRAMREWNVSRFWMEKNATVRFLYSWSPTRKRRMR
jgi:hypothetical protein